MFLTEAGFRGQRQLDIPIVIDEGLRLDVMVNNLVICELKALEQAHPVWQAELSSYLKVTEQRLGSLIHFNVPLIKDGIKRMILQLALLQHCVHCFFAAKAPGRDDARGAALQTVTRMTPLFFSRKFRVSL